MTTERKTLEHQIVGVLLNDQPSIQKCKARGILDSMFLDPLVGRLYAKILAIDKKGAIPDLAILLDEYSDDNEMLNVVLDCSQSFAHTAQFDGWLLLFLEGYGARKMGEYASKYCAEIKEGKEFEEATENLISTARKAISFCTKKPRKDNLIKIAEAHKMIELMASNPDSHFCRYCIPGVDGIFRHGKKQLHILGAPPGSGKTGFTLSCLLNQIKQGIKVVLFVNETPSEFIFQRLLAMCSGMPSWKVEDLSRLGGEEQVSFIRALELLAKCKDNYRIFGKGEYKHSPLSIDVELAALGDEGFVPDFVAVDYLQNMRHDRHNEKLHRSEFIESCVFEINQVFAKYNVAGLLLSQLNRGRDDDSNEFKMSDLKGSSAIEQEADYITFLKRAGRGYEGIVNVSWYSVKTRGGREVNAELRFDTGNGLFLGTSREVVK